MKSGEDEIQPSSSSAITTKVRVLCLHGYRQNADSFKSKLGSFRKMLNKYAEFVFITAPHQVPELTFDPDRVDRSTDSQQKSWWFNHDNGTFKGTNENGPAFGFEESVRLIEKIWDEQGPFDGLLGFSQGASMVGILCALNEKGMTNVKPVFAIMSSGFRSGSLAHIKYYENMIHIQSMHIFGESDEIIEMQLSQTLANTFVDPTIVQHSGGHYFASTSKEKPMYVEFFQDLLQNKLEMLELENANESNTFHINSI